MAGVRLLEEKRGITGKTSVLLALKRPTISKANCRFNLRTSEYNISNKFKLIISIFSIVKKKVWLYED